MPCACTGLGRIVVQSPRARGWIAYRREEGLGGATEPTGAGMDCQRNATTGKPSYRAHGRGDGL